MGLLQDKTISTINVGTMYIGLVNYLGRLFSILLNPNAVNNLFLK